MAGGWFSLRLMVPAEARFAGLVRSVVAHGAREAGSAEAEAFGGQVEQVVRELAASGPGDAGSIDVAVRHDSGQMEVVVSTERETRTLTMEI